MSAECTEAANDTAVRIQSMLDKKARLIFNRSIYDVQEWLTNRFNEIGLVADDDVNLYLNPWNESGYGLQSVTVEVKRESRDVMHGDEIKHPTIGIISSGLLSENAQIGLCQFVPDDCENIKVLNYDGLLIDVAKNEEITEDSPIPEHRLTSSDPFEATGPDEVVRILMELENPSPEQIRTDALEEIRELIGLTRNRPDQLKREYRKLISGVYACEFLRKP